MVDTITTDLDPVPSRSAPSTFSSRMDNWLRKISTWTDEANALATGANTNKLAAEAAQTAAELAETNAEAARDIAQSSADYEGLWSSLTGSATAGISVSHGGVYWRLNVDLADITASEPSITNSDWQSSTIQYQPEASTTAATTTALGSTTTKHLLTGVATITGFTGTAGVTYSCRVRDGVGLAHHATNLIITQGGASIVAAAGDTFDVQMITGTTCRIVNYQWAGSNTKLISFTRSMSAASGNVSYSAVGFKPSVLLFMASIIDGTSFASWGMGLPGTDFSVSTRPTGYAPSSPWSIMLYEDTSLWQGAKVESLDDDGFTLAWTKTGAPDYRLATIYCLAIR